MRGPEICAPQAHFEGNIYGPETTENCLIEDPKQRIQSLVKDPKAVRGEKGEQHTTNVAVNRTYVTVNRAYVTAKLW